MELLSGKRITRNRKDLVRTNEGFKERSKDGFEFIIDPEHK